MNARLGLAAWITAGMLISLLPTAAAESVEPVAPQRYAPAALVHLEIALGGAPIPLDRAAPHPHTGVALVAEAGTYAINRRGTTLHDLLGAIGWRVDAACLTTPSGDALCARDGAALRIFVDGRESNATAMAAPLSGQHHLLILYTGLYLPPDPRRDLALAEGASAAVVGGGLALWSLRVGASPRRRAALVATGLVVAALGSTGVVGAFTLLDAETTFHRAQAVSGSSVIVELALLGADGSSLGGSYSYTEAHVSAPTAAAARWIVPLSDDAPIPHGWPSRQVAPWPDLKAALQGRFEGEVVGGTLQEDDAVAASAFLARIVGVVYEPQRNIH